MGKIVAIAVSIVVVIALLVTGFMCVTTVPAGYVAVQYKMNGGVTEDVLTQGWHVVSPTTKTTLYSTALRQSYLTADSTGDSKSDESFSVSSSEGKGVTVEMTFSYQYEKDNVVKVFNQFGGASGTDIRDSFIKPKIMAWSKEVFAHYKVEDMLGEKRAEINSALSEAITPKFAFYGITITEVAVSDYSVDEETSKAINAKITAKQNAETKAIENQTAIDKASADATVKTTTAQAEADALLIQAEAQAKANELLTESLSEKILKQNWIKQWNGELPKMFTSEDGSNIMLNLDDFTTVVG